MKKLLFLYSFLFVFRIQSQSSKTSNFEFIDVNILINDLIKNDYVSNYSFSLDYDTIITLDIASIPVLKKMDPWYFEKFDVSEYKIKRKFNYDFSSKVKFKKIRTLFSNEKLFESITKGQLKFSELGEVIYIKDNRIAVFETYGGDFSSSYRTKYKVILFKEKAYFEVILSEIADFARPLSNEMKMVSDSVIIDIPKK